MSVTLSGSGQVPVQVIQTLKTDAFTSTATSFTDVTGLSVSITPTNSLNKVLVMAQIMGGASSLCALRLTRNGTAIALADASGSRTRGTVIAFQYAGTNGDRGAASNICFLDSPATTSSVTYQIQGFADSGTWGINRNATDADASYNVRAISTITVMEISG
jgi:hypothetical protein